MYRGTYSAPKYLNTYYAYQNTPPAPQKKFPQDIQCIIKSSDPNRGSLYLSNVQAAQNIQTVKRLKVGAILTCAKGYMLSHPKQIVPHYKYIAGQDKQSFDISLHFQEAVQFIRDALTKTNIIVHCIAGVSRSVSMVIAYFIKHHDLSYTQAYHTVKSKRKIISPNDGFIKQLKIFQQKTRQRNSLHDKKLKEQSATDKTGQFYTPKKVSASQLIQTNDKSMSSTTRNLQQKNDQKYSQLKRLNTYNGQKEQRTPQFQRYDSIQNYQRYSKSMSFIPNNELPLNQQQKNDLINRNTKDFSPRKTLFSNNNKDSRQDRLYGGKTGGYFDSMNKQLNDKIQSIRKKYQEQRQEMLKGYNKRGYSSTNLASNTNQNLTPKKNQYQSLNNQNYQFRQKSPVSKNYTTDSKKVQYSDHYYNTNDISQPKKYADFINKAKNDPKNKYNRYEGIYGNKYSKYDYGKQYNKYDTIYGKRDVGAFESSANSTQIYRRIYF